VRVSLDQSAANVRDLIDGCDGILLPGSKADINPARFDAPRDPQTAASDLQRETVDDLMLAAAYKLRKAILGICYGLQSLNVYRGGSLIQHIPDFLPEETRGKVDHEAGKDVPVAHSVTIDPKSRLARIVGGSSESLTLPVNSSHHQSANNIGVGLRVVARCTVDNIVEAVEGIDPDHFILAAQWHPERSVDADEASRALFRALIEAARERQSA